jgi:zinc protease
MEEAIVEENCKVPASILTRRELQKWWSEGVTAEELATRKRSLIGSYQVGLSNSEGIAGTIMQTIQRGYDLKWLDEYPRAIEALTLEQVNAAIRKHIDPNAMVLIEAGMHPGSS